MNRFFICREFTFIHYIKVRLDRSVFSLPIYSRFLRRVASPWIQYLNSFQIPDIFSHDIAILEIPYPGIEFNEYAQPICLPSKDFVYTPGRQCVVSGWGSMGLRMFTKRCIRSSLRKFQVTRNDFKQLSFQL